MRCFVLLSCIKSSLIHDLKGRVTDEIIATKSYGSYRRKRLVFSLYGEGASFTHLMDRLVGSKVVSTIGPNGQKVSKVFPRSHCPPFRFFCQSRPDTSLAMV